VAKIEIPNEKECRTRDTDKDQSSRFASDTEIRKALYTIHSRPKHGSVLWEKKGVVYAEGEVIFRLRADQEKALEI
jgi:hypothetical protein